MTAWLLLLLVIVLIAVNAFFVMVEFSLVTVDRSAVRRAAATGDAGAGSVATALEHLSMHLSGAQFGITISSLVVGYVAEPSIATLLRTPLTALGLPEASALAVSVTAAFLIATISQMVFGELVPKNWAIAEPMRVAALIARPQALFATLSRPLLAFFNGTANMIVRLFGIEPQEELASARSPQELSALAVRSATEGTLDDSLASHVSRSAELSQSYAADAMTPRAKIRYLGADEPVSHVLSATIETGFSRFPVVGADTDQVIGAVHFKHALAVPTADRDRRTVSEVCLPIAKVPSSMPLDNVLAELRAGLQIAAVIDEFDGTHGIITLEDLVEEILGEIEDEQDEHEERLRQVGDRAWECAGLLRPDEIARFAGVVLPEGKLTESLSGLITERLERFPREGDVITVAAQDRNRLDGDGMATSAEAALRVLHLDGTRADLVRITLTEPASGRPAKTERKKTGATGGGET